MSTGTVAAAVGVVIIVVIVGFFAFRPDTTEAPTPLPTSMFEEVGGDVEVSVTEADSDDSDTDTGTQSSAVAEEESTDQEVVISIDETGFTPATVTIATGTTVTFVNNGQGRHWPASDVHPTHEILPEFDAKRGLATGETYSYTFTELGTWRMHDHLQASSTGTIVVE